MSRHEDSPNHPEVKSEDERAAERSLLHQRGKEIVRIQIPFQPSDPVADPVDPVSSQLTAPSTPPPPPRHLVA
eukprot:749418-Hanusia_phi.AAC.5